jgi:predicted amidophosphoribosyltransferase
LLKNCQVCNKVFAHPTRTMCDECYKEVQASFEAVKDYLLKNPGATVAEVAQETEIDVEVIYEFIREGRLSVIPRDAQLSCEICGDPITVGRVCRKCRSELDPSSAAPFQPSSRASSGDSRVRYLDQIKRQR